MNWPLDVVDTRQDAVLAMPASAPPVQKPRRRFRDFTARHAFVAGVVVALVQFGAAFVYGIEAESDFGIFQSTTRRFVDGLRMYSSGAVDFTPPLFHVLLLPLVHMPPALAFALWTALNAAVGWFVYRTIVRGVPGAWTRRWTIAAWIANLAGVHMTVRLGQVSWLVALVITLAWLAMRARRWTTAGVWAGVAIAFKPFFLLLVPVMAVKGQWKALATAVATVAVCCALSVLCFGREPFADWVHNLRGIPDPGYATHFLNASWVAFITRAHAPYWIATALSALTILLMLWRVGTWDEDVTWFVLGIVALLASPVGWVYYQPMLLGPAVALAIDGRLRHLRWIGFTCFVPALSSTLFQGSSVVALTLGSVYFWGLFAAFASLAFWPGQMLNRDGLADSAPASDSPVAA